MMESDSSETASSDVSDEMWQHLRDYIDQNRNSTNTQLFQVLALLKAYVPESYLPMQLCQQILGPPDPIHGGPPFEDRMQPFTDFIDRATPDQVCLIRREDAQIVLKILAKLGINRSTNARKLLSFLGGELQKCDNVVKSVEDLLRKRERKESGNREENFSRLITDILNQDGFDNAVSVLETASRKFGRDAFYPQTIARLYYIEERDYETAAEWAKRAIEKAPQNSYVADTLGQIHKNRLRKALLQKQPNVLEIARRALKAFKDVENKAEAEKDLEDVDPDGTVKASASFNNRGHFGFIQVAKIIFSNLQNDHFKEKLTREVEEKFEFFEWYLTYSMPDMKTFEPHYFWKDITDCYECYTGNIAASSTSFPGLLDCLNHGIFTSQGRYVMNEKTTPDLETIRDDLEITHQENPDDIAIAMRYILSNIILNNRRQIFPRLPLLTQLQSVIQRVFRTHMEDPEFYLLALMLFWPDEQQHETDDEVEGEAAEDEASNDEQETEEAIQPPATLQENVTSMKNAFEGKYAKYLRGRYLLPLFFLGKGHGLSKWVHKSRLDAIVGEEFASELAELQNDNRKEEKITDLWCNGEVWRVQRIRDLLLPVQVEPNSLADTPEELEEREVSVKVGEQEMTAKMEVRPDDPSQRSGLFYLYLTIQGPVVINV